MKRRLKFDLNFGAWDGILLYREARNKLVHSSLQLTKQPASPISQALTDFLKGAGSVKFKADDTFVISKRAFIEKFCAVAEGYLKNAFDTIVPLVKEPK